MKLGLTVFTLLFLTILSSLTCAKHGRRRDRGGSCDDSNSELSSISSSQEEEAVKKFKDGVIKIIQTYDKSLRKTLKAKNRTLGKLLLAKRGLGEMAQLEIAKEWALAGIEAAKERFNQAHSDLKATIQGRWRYGQLPGSRRRNQFASSNHRSHHRGDGDERQRDILRPGRTHGLRDDRELAELFY